MEFYFFARGPVRFYEPHEESSRAKTSCLYTLDEDLTSRLSAIQLSSISAASNDGKDSLNYSVDSNNSTERSSDGVQDLSWNVSRFEVATHGFVLHMIFTISDSRLRRSRGRAN